MKKKQQVVLAALAFTLVLAAGIGRAQAYFTAYTEARGGYALRLGGQTEIEETFSSWQKRVSIQNHTDSSGPVYVRARAWCGSGYALEYGSDSGRWTADGEKNDGWYYYSVPLAAGETADELLVSIKCRVVKENGEMVLTDIPDSPDKSKGQQDAFQVAVVYESTPVRYDEGGAPYADWTFILENGEGGVEQ